ncbi:MAG TPA: NlpC/P60 family protein [Stellaceae bacterium]|nr:NlpC/P60 family protein [Stellaceae bacterium]
MPTAPTSPAFDHRLHAIREDLADSALRDKVDAPRYAEGREGHVIAGLAPVRRAPRGDAPVDTYYHFGEPVRVFDEAAGFAWCQSRRDRYVGYVAAAALQPGEPPQPTHYVAGRGAYRYAEPDLRAPAVDFLPRHAPVSAAQQGLECRGTRYMALAGGGFMPEGCVATAPPQSRDLAAAASLYLGCPYLWGGRSALGIDCSGLVQEAFRDLGRTVPRDADLQATTIGKPVAAADPAALRRNDLVFMPGHVMICAGRGRVIHAYGGDMSVRRDRLADLLRGWGRVLAELAVRRPG